MPTTAPLPDTGDLEALLEFVAQAAIDDISTDAFLRRFHASAATLAPTIFAVIEDPAARRAAIGHFGRVFWSRMPKPGHGWRAVPTPKPERNGPCPCGSGKKYKQCCQPYEAPDDMIPELNMLEFVLDLWPESKAHELPLRRMNSEALADVASQWLKEGNGERAVRLLERLFNDSANVDERYISCFDALCDVYSEVGLHEERDVFIAQISAHANKYLASAALQRATAIASDKGDYDAAWERFGQAMRLTPDDPSLSHLEVLVLMSQGRVDEAKARAAIWAARLRRMNRAEYDDLIEFLEQTALNPDRAMLEMAERDLPEDETWSDLLDAAPEVELMYEIDADPTADNGQGPGRVDITMKPLPSLARVERDWRDRFFVEKPDLVDLYGDATTGAGSRIVAPRMAGTIAR